MHQHLKDELAEHILETIKSKPNLSDSDIKNAINDFFKDIIAITWTIDDIDNALERDLGYSKSLFNDADKIKALNIVLEKHDASMGVSLDTIDEACRIVIEDMTKDDFLEKFSISKYRIG